MITLTVKTGQQQSYFKNFIRVIRSCSVSSHAWEQRNPDGKASGYTSPLRKDKKILFAGLPSTLNSILRPETVSAVVKVWIGFAEIYTVVHNRNHEKDPKDFFTKAKEWIFLSEQMAKEKCMSKQVTHSCTLWLHTFQTF